MKKNLEPLIYAVLVVLGLAALGLFAVLPKYSLITGLVYKGF